MTQSLTTDVLYDEDGVKYSLYSRYKGRRIKSKLKFRENSYDLSENLRIDVPSDPLYQNLKDRRSRVLLYSYSNII